MTGAGRSWPLIGVLLLGVFTGATINNIAAAPLSLIAEDFNTSPAKITLVASASGFALACFMPVAGWLSVRWGTRRILGVAYSLLLLGCLLAGLADSVLVLTLARVLQGLAMSVVPPTVMYALPMIAGVERREHALGWWAIANGAGTAAGAPLGAVIADTLGWRAMFLVFVPVCALLVLGSLWLRADAEVQGPLDMPGAILVTVAVALLISPILTAGVGVPVGVVAGVLVMGFLATVLFYRRLSRTKRPLVTQEFLRSSGFLVGTLGGASQMFTLGSVSVLIPLILLGQGISLGLAGAFVLLITFTMMVSATPVSALVPKLGAGRIIMVGLWLGASTLSASAWLLSRGWTGAAVGTLLLLGVALGCLQSPSAIVVSVEKSSRGSGVGVYNSLRFGAGVLGISWLSLMTTIGLQAGPAMIVAALPVVAAGVVVTAHQMHSET